MRLPQETSLSREAPSVDLLGRVDDADRVVASPLGWRASVILRIVVRKSINDKQIGICARG